MTKRKWREELKRREIEAQRRHEIEELERRRLIGVKNTPAIGNGTNHPDAGRVRTVFLKLNKCEFKNAQS